MSSPSFTTAPIRAPLDIVGSHGITRWSTAIVFMLVALITNVNFAILPGVAKGNPGSIDIRAKSPPTKHNPCGPWTNRPPLNINLQQSAPRIIALVPVWQPLHRKRLIEIYSLIYSDKANFILLIINISLIYGKLYKPYQQ